MNISIFIYIWLHWLAGCFNINIMTCVFWRWYWTHWRLQRPIKREGKHCLVTWLEVLGMEWNTSWTCCIGIHTESGKSFLFGTLILNLANLLYLAFILNLVKWYFSTWYQIKNGNLYFEPVWKQLFCNRVMGCCNCRQNMGRRGHFSNMTLAFDRTSFYHIAGSF